MKSLLPLITLRAPSRSTIHILLDLADQSDTRYRVVQVSEEGQLISQKSAVGRYGVSYGMYMLEKLHDYTLQAECPPAEFFNQFVN